MAILFYAYYGHTNSQLLIGSGSNSNGKNTGLKSSFGMTDTTSATGNTDSINFWGLENWWGNKWEWCDNITIFNGVATITEDDGSTRTVTCLKMSGANYPNKFVIGDNLDLLVTVSHQFASDTTGYCDTTNVVDNSTNTYAVALSDAEARATGGVSFFRADFGDNFPDGRFGCRLAFTGTIQIV